MKRKVSIVPPEEFANLTVTAIKKKAVGVPAIVSTMKHISKELGIWQGIKVLNKMNQKASKTLPARAAGAPFNFIYSFVYNI